jgi:hypothetical protein
MKESRGQAAGSGDEQTEKEESSEKQDSQNQDEEKWPDSEPGDIRQSDQN